MEREATIKQQQELWQAYYRQLNAYYVSRMRMTLKNKRSASQSVTNSLTSGNKHPPTKEWKKKHFRLPDCWRNMDMDSIEFHVFSFFRHRVPYQSFGF